VPVAADVPLRARLEELIASCPDDQVAELIGELARAQAVLAPRLHQRHSSERQSSVRQLDRYLTANEVAELLSLDRKWIYDHQHDLGGVKMGGLLRFPSRAVRRYLDALEAMR